MSRLRRTFTAEFKLQMVKLYENGKSRADIAREYDITPSTLEDFYRKFIRFTYNLSEIFQ